MRSLKMKRSAPAARGRGLACLCLVMACLTTGTATAQRVTNGLLALYGFDEGAGGTVLDVSGVAPALNLTIENTGLVTWLPGGGLSLASGARLATPGAATKVIAAARATNELTIEAWIQPANVTQTGPARIVTISSGTDQGNFTLGQAPYPSPIDAFTFRLRTTLTDATGSPSLNSSAGSATTSLTHVVCTRDNAGNRRLYINGALAANDVSAGDFTGWNNTFSLLVGNENGAARPWAGVVRLIAVFDRDLTLTEIAQNRAAGPDLSPGGNHAPGDIIIAAVQGANTPAGQNPGEFVELFNTTDQPISLAEMLLISRVDTNADGVLDLDWQLSADLGSAVIGPHSFFLIAEAGVAAPGGIHDVEADLDLATGEGGAAERAISLELRLDGDHLDYVLYGRHDGQTPAGESPPGDLPFNGTSWPRAEVIRNTTGETSFLEGLLRRVSATALYAGHAVAGYYTDETSLGAGFPNGVWTSPHDETFGAYQARNSLSPPVLPGASVAVTVGVAGSGSVALSPTGGVYPPGTLVQLTANAGAGWTFDHWSGGLTGSANPASVTANSDLDITAHFSGTAVSDGCEDFESGYALNAELSGSADWFYAAAADGPNVQAGVGVAGSIGLTNGERSFAWVADGFAWSDAQTSGVWVQMDFQTSATGVFDDDRLGWTISDTDDSSDGHFGVQMDPGGAGAGGNIECYWDGATFGDDGGRVSIVDLPALAGTAWYRLRADFTKLTATSCRIDVELRELNAAGDEVGVVVTGSLGDTSLLGGNSAPNPGYFNAATAWPVFKNHTAAAGAVDNACWGITVPAAPSVRFAAFGDFGQAGPNELAVANLIDSFEPDFCITTGDNSYGSNSIDVNVGQYYSQYIGNYQGAYGPGSGINRFFPSLGNHDYTDGAGLNAYLSYFTLPGAGVPGSGSSGNERYFDFVQGAVHFFVIDSNVGGIGSPAAPGDGRSPTSAQGVWLQTQLAQSTSPWKIVYMHHPPYSSSSNHGSEVVMRWPYEAWGADAVLSGHDHLYERVLRDDNADGVDLPYFVTGAGGKSLYGFTTPVSGSQVRFNANYGSMIVDADDQSITFRFHSINPGDGTNGLVDTYTIGSAPAMYSLTTSTIGGGSVSLSPPGGPYVPGTEVQLTAVPAGGWAFDHWSGDLAGSANPATIIMNGNRQVTATFTSEGALSAGDIIISALQAWNNPAGQDPGEFVELFNTTNQPVSLAGLQLTSRVDTNSDGVVDVDWQLAPDLTGVVIAPHGFYLIAEAGVAGENGVRDLTASLDLATGEGGAAERAISLELAIGGTHLDYVVYGRHDGQTPAGGMPPGDRAFDGVSWPRTEVIRNTTGDANFQEGLLKRESPEALYAGYNVEGFYTDEPALGDGYPTGVWTSPHDEAFGAYVARNSTSAAVPPVGNQAPAAPTVVAPLDNAVGVLLEAQLQVNVTDPDQDGLNVTFFGRPVGAAAGDAESKAAYANLGTANNAPSGSNVVMAWPALGPNTEYEWYVDVTDGVVVTTSSVWSFTTDNASGVGDSAIPERLATAGNFPNPFNPSTRIRFALPATGHLEITVFDLQGRAIRKLVDGDHVLGVHEVAWDGRDGSGQAVPSGSYFYRIAAGGAVVTGKMILMK